MPNMLPFVVGASEEYLVKNKLNKELPLQLSMSEPD